jgi:putative nucleotidyltransferase with HDIG domain
MPLPGDGTNRAPFTPPAALLQQARERERAGSLPEAIERYETAIATAQQVGDQPVLAEALRRFAVVRHQRGDTDQARGLCVRSYGVAHHIGDDVLAAEALNTLGVMDITTGSLQDARETFLRVLDLGGASQALRARAEQNLGIVANIQGQLSEAVARYERSLDAYRNCGDEHGCAIAYHNLGMVSADRGRLDAADCYFQESRSFAERVGDVHLWALCLLNHAEVHVARQRFEDARQNAESALAIFDQLGAQRAKADTYRVFGMVYRETGRPALAESRLRSAIDLASAAGSALGEAEASRELALLHQTMGRNVEALSLLNAAYRLFRRLDARVDLVDVGGKMAELEGSYLALVRAWGQSLESTDNYTYGHCERVAKNAVAMARVLGLDEQAETTILLGAYLHDLGMVRVPHEILRKPGPLSSEEQRVLQMHPIWGLDLLATVEFPWELKPIIRSHHEHFDGTGYPDHLKREEIPLAAQIVGILDVYDSLTTKRGDRPGMTLEQALAELTRRRGWWSDQVFGAFLQVIAVSAPAARAAAESAESR